MIKCTICEYHTQNGKKHTCKKCDTKTVYGVIQEQFIEGCNFFLQNNQKTPYTIVKAEYRKVLKEIQLVSKTSFAGVKKWNALETKAYKLEKLMRELKKINAGLEAEK